MRAAQLWLDCVSNSDVIEAALKRSSETPGLTPKKYELKDDDKEVVLDDAKRPQYTDGYKFYLQCLVKPRSVSAFQKQIEEALSGRFDSPPVLIISRYTGGKWWGATWYDFFYDPLHRLCREEPSQGYFYIRLNADKLSAPTPGWNDPRFWASKIAHETLHALGYWHPNYDDPEARDGNNKGDDWAFIVAFEAAMHEYLSSVSQ